jgi:hypothetical protein
MSTIPSRASRTQDYELEEDDAYYTQRPHSSAVRLTRPRQQVIRRGHKRVVIHNEPPPRRVHWLLILGLGMLTMFLLWVGSTAFLN